MGSKWVKTNYPGVRYREHPSRKHNGRPDRYFTLRYRLNGKLKEEGLGWASEKLNAQKAAGVLASLKKDQREGKGPRTLRERREKRNKEDEERRQEEDQQARDRIPIDDIFHQHYWPQAQDKKSARREMSLFKNHISPQVGDKPLKEISQVQFQAIKSSMKKKGAADRSIQYCFALLRQIFNFASDNNLFDGSIPKFSKLMPSRIDRRNRRDRYLTKKEADSLLNELKKKSHETFEISYLSLYSGLRAGEIFNLKWGDIDFHNEILTVREAKSGYNRYVPMFEGVKALLKAKGKGGPEKLVFPARKKGKAKARERISRSFDRTIDKLKLNEGVKDRRKKLVFHSLRHTFASWLIQKGESLHTVQHLLGHRTSIMTDRYSHVNDEILKKAIANLG